MPGYFSPAVPIDISTSPQVINPSTCTALMGATTSAALFQMREAGNFYVNSGNPIAGNAADTTDDVLTGIVLPAGIFDIAGRQLIITASGLTAANTNNKRAKIFINPTLSAASTTSALGVISGGVATGGSVVADTSTWVNGTTPNSNVNWILQATVSKYGVAGSNTQLSNYTLVLGGVHGGVVNVATTFAESGSITIVVTGASYTTGAANDVKLQLFEVVGNN